MLTRAVKWTNRKAVTVVRIYIASESFPTWVAFALFNTTAVMADFFANSVDAAALANWDLLKTK